MPETSDGIVVALRVVVDRRADGSQPSRRGGSTDGTVETVMELSAMEESHHPDAAQRRYRRTAAAFQLHGAPDGQVDASTPLDATRKPCAALSRSPRDPGAQKAGHRSADSAVHTDPGVAGFDSADPDDFFGVKVLFVHFSGFPVVVVGGVLQPVIKSAFMVLLVLIHILDERHNLVQV